MNKTCTKCNITKDISQFNKNTTNKSNGYRPECKQCKAKLRKPYYQNHKEYIKQYVKKYRKNNKHIYEAYYKKNKKRFTEKNKRWALENPEKRREIDRRRRDRKKHLDCNYTKSDEKYTLDLFDHKCVYCGSTKDLQIDHHYPLAEGYALTIKNAVVLCGKHNRMKWKKLPEDFYSPERLQMIENKLKETVQDRS